MTTQYTETHGVSWGLRLPIKGNCVNSWFNSRR